MPNESANSIISTVTRLIDNNIDEGTGLDNLVTVLSLLCLICIFTRQHGTATIASSAGNNNPVNKLIGDLMKGGAQTGGAGGMDTIMSLLPLLNNPQLKSKLNPATISSVLGMLNNFGGSSSEKQESPKEKPPEKSKEQPKEEPKNEREDFSGNDSEEQENKSLGRYLNWKTNF
jgi:hypothetical protein